ncbi:MAG TPA: hypothetical protein VH164_11930 [Ktedonobacteraceae bacterium]|nr:hypothetical protein [Ktedonobacteraceae bacterium]
MLANRTIRGLGTPLLNCMSDLALYARRAYAVAIAAGGTDCKKLQNSGERLMHSPHYAAEWKDFTPTRESGKRIGRLSDCGRVADQD